MTAVSDREQKILGIIETARGKRAKFRDDADHHGPRRRRQGDPGADRGPVRAGVRRRRRSASWATPARVEVDGAELAMTTDSYVVKPLRFPGGSIGELAVNGTVNDLAVSGARPLALTLSLVLEEGLPADELRAEVEAIAARRRARPGSQIVAGDTKVVERGHADGMYMCTTGIGRRDPRAKLSPAALRPGDRILLSGSIGEHGTAIMLARGEFELDAEIESDTRSLWPAVDALLDAAGPRAALHARRDPRRRRLGAERARARLVGGDDRARGRRPGRPGGGRRRRDPRDRPDVRRQRGQAGRVRRARGGGRGARGAACASTGCEAAAEIGEVRTEPPGMVLVQTSFGGRRVMDQLVGDPLPRIC